MKAVTFFILFIYGVSYAGIKVGQVPPAVTLKGDSGGKVDGSPWHSADLKGKLHLLFYVDPDEDKLNEHVADAIKAKKYPNEKYHSIGIVNMDATWLPNFAIESKLEEKQAKFKDVTYVKDLEKVLVNKWGLGDDSYAVVALNSAGEVIFLENKKVSDARLKELITLIEQNI